MLKCSTPSTINLALAQLHIKVPGISLHHLAEIKTIPPHYQESKALLTTHSHLDRCRADFLSSRDTNTVLPSDTADRRPCCSDDQRLITDTSAGTSIHTLEPVSPLNYGHGRHLHLAEVRQLPPAWL